MACLVAPRLVSPCAPVIERARWRERKSSLRRECLRRARRGRTSELRACACGQPSLVFAAIDVRRGGWSRSAARVAGSARRASAGRWRRRGASDGGRVAGRGASAAVGTDGAVRVAEASRVRRTAALCADAAVRQDGLPVHEGPARWARCIREEEERAARFDGNLRPEVGPLFSHTVVSRAGSRRSERVPTR